MQASVRHSLCRHEGHGRELRQAASSRLERPHLCAMWRLHVRCCRVWGCSRRAQVQRSGSSDGEEVNAGPGCLGTCLVHVFVYAGNCWPSCCGVPGTIQAWETVGGSKTTQTSVLRELNSSRTVGQQSPHIRVYSSWERLWQNGCCHGGEARGGERRRMLWGRCPEHLP